MTATGFGDESQIGPRDPDPSLCAARGLVWSLVPEPVWTRGGICHPACSPRVVRRVGRPGRIRLMVPAKDEDAAMTISPTRRWARRAFATAAAVVIGGSASVLACPLCFG